MPLPRRNFLVMLFSVALLLAAVDAYALPIADRSSFSFTTDGSFGNANDERLISLTKETETGQPPAFPYLEEQRVDARFGQPSLGDYRFEGHSFTLARSYTGKLSR